MAQPQKKNIVKNPKVSKPTVKKKKGGSVNKKRNHPKYGTSKLEEKFAKEFLDKLNIKYIYQYEAKGIGRYYDYYLPQENLIVECDGDYWHSFGLVHEEKNRMQKHNEWVDKEKDEWALMHGIPILRIWEHDINEHPQKVLKLLKEKCASAKKEVEIKKKRNMGLKWT